MEIYLLRHGIAALPSSSGEQDDLRPLTEEGKAKMQKQARGATRLISHFDIIFTSPLRRAQQTAEIIGEVFECKDKIEICPQLTPGFSPRNLISFLGKYKGKNKILLVGHEPDLSCFVSFLLGIEQTIFEFKKGALGKITLDDFSAHSHARFSWYVTPKILRSLAKK